MAGNELVINQTISIPLAVLERIIKEAVEDETGRKFVNMEFTLDGKYDEWTVAGIEVEVADWPKEDEK